MSETGKQLVTFGRFTFSLSEHVLTCYSEFIHLPLRTAGILGYLIQNRDRVVSRQEIQERFWPGLKSVEPNTVQQHLSKIREALADPSKEEPKFIKTTYGRGWQFIAAVTEHNIASEDNLPTADSGDLQASPSSMNGSGIENFERPESEAALTVALEMATGRRNRLAPVLAAIACVCAVIVIWAAMPSEYGRVLDSIPVTTDGRPKEGPLFTDGRRLFYIEIDPSGHWSHLMCVPIGGGESTRLKIPFPLVSLEDISADKSSLLLRSLDNGGTRLWKYELANGAVKEITSNNGEVAAWSPDGTELAASSLNALSVRGGTVGDIHRAVLPEKIMDLTWSPNGKRIRFSVLDPRQEKQAEWEWNLNAEKPFPVSLFRDGGLSTSNGSWSIDERYFFFRGGDRTHKDIWVTKQDRLFSKPIRITKGGPGSWSWPMTSSTPSTVFAINSLLRSELVRYDPLAGIWRTEWDIAAYDLAYSRDSDWVAYTSLRDHTIWKARSDGTRRVQLTPVGIEAHQPHWSPDGKWIAFMGKNLAGYWRVFRVLASGGMPTEVAPSQDDQGVPTWSANGQMVIFGERLSGKPRSQMALHMFDFRTRALIEMPGTKGLWGAHDSPDGKYLAAVTTDSRQIRIKASTQTVWTVLTTFRFVDNIMWSKNSHYIYFNGYESVGNQGIFRAGVPDGKVERLVDLTDFSVPPENWYGVAPDDGLLAFRGVRADDVYALNLDLR